MFGVKFIGVDPEIERAVTSYIFARLPELYA
jgi:c-di-GMP-binding flagellar brake protein YcgR